MARRASTYIAALKEAREVLLALGVIGSAFLLVGGWLFQYGLRWVDKRNEARIAPFVDVVMYDLDRRGVLKDYREHKAHLDSNRALLEQRDASALPYPLMRSSPN